MIILSIAPRLPPAIDGVGDYALNLAHQLFQEFGIETHFVVSDLGWMDESQVESFPVSQLKAYTPAALLALLQNSSSATVLLHYVGYGYAKRGCPIWLIEGLEKWKAGNSRARLVTMFHEVYAFSAPWHSSFWLSPLQRNLAARLVAISDRCITSSHQYAHTLQRLCYTQKPIFNLPVFSTVGEPLSVSKLESRYPRLVIFGQPHNKIPVYQTALSKLKYICETLNIKEILDVGPKVELELPLINGIPIIKAGEMSAADVGNLLLNTRAGFINYQTNRLAKSTILAAYCAHGVLPISYQKHSSETDGLVFGKHYWVPAWEIARPNMTDMQRIASNAYNWYQGHNLHSQAHLFAKTLDFSEI